MSLQLAEGRGWAAAEDACSSQRRVCLQGLIPASSCGAPWEAAGGGSRGWAPVTHVGDLSQGLNAQPRTVVNIGRVEQVVWISLARPTPFLPERLLLGPPHALAPGAPEPLSFLGGVNLDALFHLTEYTPNVIILTCVQF